MNCIRSLFVAVLLLFLCGPAHAAIVLTAGETLAKGDLIKLNASGQAVKTTADTDFVIGVARGGYPVGTNAVIDEDGKVTVKCGSGVTIGEYLGPSSTAGTANDGSSDYSVYSFAVAITAHSGGTCTAVLFPIHSDTEITDRSWQQFFMTQAVTEGSSVQNISFPTITKGGKTYKCNQATFWNFTVTPTGGGSDVDVKLFSDDAGSNVLAFWEAWDASAATLTHKSGIRYRDGDNTQELHVMIDAITGGPGTYTITVDGICEDWQ